MKQNCRFHRPLDTWKFPQKIRVYFTNYLTTKLKLNGVHYAIVQFISAPANWAYKVVGRIQGYPFNASQQYSQWILLYNTDWLLPVAYLFCHLKNYIVADLKIRSYKLQNITANQIISVSHPLMRPTKIMQLNEATPLKLSLLLPESKLYQTWIHIHQHIYEAKSKKPCFWMQTLQSMTDMRQQKSMLKKATCMGHSITSLSSDSQETDYSWL